MTNMRPIRDEVGDKLLAATKKVMVGDTVVRVEDAEDIALAAAARVAMSPARSSVDAEVVARIAAYLYGTSRKWLNQKREVEEAVGDAIALMAEAHRALHQIGEADDEADAGTS